MTKYSPLFETIHENIAHVVRVGYSLPPVVEKLPEPAHNLTLRGVKSGSGMTVSILKLPPQIEIKSIEEAEKKIFDLAATANFTFRPKLLRENFVEVDDSNFVFGIMVNRAANMIAQLTRRGAGNILLMHPDYLHYLQFDAASEPTQYGLWEHVGILNSTIKVFTSTSIPEHHAYVIYVGSTADAPGHLINKDDKTFLSLLEAEPSKLGNSADYIQRIDIFPE